MLNITFQAVNKSVDNHTSLVPRLPTVSEREPGNEATIRTSGRANGWAKTNHFSIHHQEEFLQNHNSNVLVRDSGYAECMLKMSLLTKLAILGVECS